MEEKLLPAEFEDLEWLVSKWALDTEEARTEQRHRSSMDQIRRFYDAVNPRMTHIIEYLNQWPLDGMPADARRLLNLILSLAEVSPAVEWYGQPGVPHGVDYRRFVPLQGNRADTK